MMRDGIRTAIRFCFLFALIVADSQASSPLLSQAPGEVTCTVRVAHL